MVSFIFKNLNFIFYFLKKLKKINTALFFIIFWLNIKIIEIFLKNKMNDLKVVNLLGIVWNLSD